MLVVTRLVIYVLLGLGDWTFDGVCLGRIQRWLKSMSVALVIREGLSNATSVDSCVNAHMACAFLSHCEAIRETFRSRIITVVIISKCAYILYRFYYKITGQIMVKIKNLFNNLMQYML